VSGLTIHRRVRILWGAGIGFVLVAALVVAAITTRIRGEASAVSGVAGGVPALLLKVDLAQGRGDVEGVREALARIRAEAGAGLAGDVPLRQVIELAEAYAGVMHLPADQPLPQAARVPLARLLPATTRLDPTPEVLREALEDALVSYVSDHIGALQGSAATLLADVDRSERLLLILGIVFLVIAATVGAAGSTVALAPVRRFQRGLRAVADGDLGGRLRVVAGDEFGELARELNAVLDQFAAFDRLKRDKIVELQWRLHRLAERVPEAVLLLDAEGVVRLHNQAARALAPGDDGGAWRDRSMHDLKLAPAVHDRLQRALDEARALDDVDVEGWRLDATPYLGADDDLVSLLVLARPTPAEPAPGESLADRPSLG